MTSFYLNLLPYFFNNQRQIYKTKIISILLNLFSILRYLKHLYDICRLSYQLRMTFRFFYSNPAYFILQLIINQFLAQIITMSQRKVWKQQEDKILKQIYEQRGIKRWSDVSRMMISIYGMKGRNSKQCRQRYHNHLKVGLKKEKWSIEEGILLVKLHIDHGNRWAFISKLIPGRSQNGVKNMLYSKLRKSLRQLNRLSHSYFHKIFYQIKINFVYKLMELTEYVHKKEESQRNQQEKTAIRIKNAILDIDFDESQELCEEDKIKVKKLIEDIYIFKRNHWWFTSFCPKTRRHKIYKKIQDQARIENMKEQLGSELEVKKQQEHANCPLILEEKRSTNDTIHGKLLNKLQHVGCSDSMADLSQGKIAESILISKERFKLNTFTVSHLDNISPFLRADNGLEYPVPVQNHFQNLTPSRQYACLIQEDWANAFFIQKHCQ